MPVNRLLMTISGYFIKIRLKLHHQIYYHGTHMNINIILYLSAYLIAGIPFGYLLAKQFAGVDIKQAGSGNIGATNVLRVVKEKDPKLAKKLGAATLFLDAIKGIVVILVAKMLGAPESVLWTIAVLSVVGHCFSAFLMFEGGKGVATGFGVLLVMMPIPALIAIAVWIGASKGLKISLFAYRADSLHHRFVCDLSGSTRDRFACPHLDHCHHYLLQTYP